MQSTADVAEETDETAQPEEEAAQSDDEAAQSEDVTAQSGGSGNGGRDEPRPDEQYCSSCGEIIKAEARICPHCGVEQKKSAGSTEKDPGVAALLSGIGFFVPIAAGAGQIYNGQVGKGIAFGLIQAVNVLLVFVLIGFVTFPLVAIYTIYDAYKTAERINEGEIQV
ncbi:hypothetical protein EA473_16980 [Natrarchaeobius chitinivorans]|uniref:Putative zinc-ribbon domain-containing protein n=1 Tax=Natrarchaeobius chitinivorans TaxID=1679083 RepID=A0A3N6LRD2_NATCH|nr:hypothetical protein EA473_16980 [Natrarchaeobius chitinivorans]